MKQVVTISSFSGGMTVSGEKAGPPGSFLYGRSIDFRKKPNQFSVLPGTASIGGGVVSDLIQDIVQTADGSRYALGNAGKFYKINTTNSVVLIEGALSGGAAGLIYRQDQDAIIMTAAQTASYFGPVSGTPSVTPDKYGPSASTDTNASRSGGGLTYTTPIAVDESTNNRCTFQPDIEPLYSIKLNIVAKGTGDWTVTIHDDANTVLATKTITTANLNSNTLNEFVFSTPSRMLVKPNARTYHVHVTSTVADGTLSCATAGDFSTADFQVLAARFVQPNNGLHPAIQFLQYNCFGNERYLSTWEPLEDIPTNDEWQRHRLTFPPGYEVCGLALYNEFLAVACEKRSTSSTKEYQDGKIFFWDGVSTTYNYFVDVPEGSPFSLFSYKNALYWFAGGSWWGYVGKAPVKLKTFPNTDSEFSATSDYTVLYPNMATVRKGVLLMGYPSETSNQSVEHGVYSWGAIDKNYPDAFGYSYQMSTGSVLNNGTNNLRLGTVRNFGDTLYLSWRDDGASPQKYGLDIVNNSSMPFANSKWESLIFDNKQPWKRKDLYTLFATFKTLPANSTVWLKYKIDRGTWQYAPSATSSGTSAKWVVGGAPFFDLQVGTDVTASATTPEVLTVGFEFDDNKEQNFIL